MLYLSGRGVNIPTLYEERIVDGRHGYIMEKIEGKLLSDKLSKDPENCDSIIRAFVELHRLCCAKALPEHAV